MLLKRAHIFGIVCGKPFSLQKLPTGAAQSGAQFKVALWLSQLCRLWAEQGEMEETEASSELASARFINPTIKKNIKKLQNWVGFLITYQKFLKILVKTLFFK